jgi:cytoskeletal protein RodZ
MAQTIPYTCSQCRTQVPANMRFCPNCGTPASAGVGGAKNPENNAGQANFSPTPPPPPGAYERTQIASPPPNPAYQQQAPQVQSGYQQPMQSVQPPPNYAKPQKKSSGGALRLGVIILLLLLILGTAGYFAFRYVSSTAKNTSHASTSQTTQATQLPTAAPTKLTPINVTVTYASVDTTIVNAQQATSFPEDSTSGNGFLRLNLKEQTAVQGIVYTYANSARLLMPDGTTVPPSQSLNDESLNQGTSRTNWIDFPVPVTTDVSTLVLQLGTTDETQISVPLKSGADVSQYQAKTVNLNTPVKYSGLDWTVISATSQLSHDGKQATKGMVYVIVTLRADNHTGSSYIGFPNNYMLLKTGDTSTPPADYSFPTEVGIGQTNATGTDNFLMPQGSTDYTLIFAADTSNNIAQATATFSIK